MAITIKTSDLASISLIDDFKKLQSVSTPIASTTHVFHKGEHYNLLRYIAQQFQGAKIIDMGTFNGLSSVAFGVNSNQVTSYDITHEYLVKDLLGAPGLDFRMKSAEDPTEIDHILDSSLIFMDIDPHDGGIESRISNTLLSRQYQGVVVADDIYLNKEMFKWWVSLPGIKIDMTQFGHWSGTGIWILPNSKIKVELE